MRTWGKEYLSQPQFFPIGIKLPENWNFDLEFCYCADDGRCYKSGWMLVIGADVLLDSSEKKKLFEK